VRLALALIVLTVTAHARAQTPPPDDEEPPPEAPDDRWERRVEAGAELDTNVQRIEVDPDGTGPTPITTPAVRAGATFAGTGERRWGRWTVGGQGLGRVVANPVVVGENVSVVAGEGRWDRRVGPGAARFGVRASYYDVLPLFSDEASRSFAIGGGDGLVTLGGEGGERFALSVGYRDFRYKPDRDFDWRGVVAALRFVTPLGRGMDLSAGYRLERRSFRGLAFTSGCGPMDPIGPTCFVPTSLPRSDLHHAAQAEVIYTGDVVASGGYLVTYNDSSSFGQSLVRHRVSASLTAKVRGVFATAIAAVQIDQYLDPLVLARDVSNQTFTSIEEENRSALSLRLSRRLRGNWAWEARWAFYADSLSQDDLEFRRQLFYGGVTWGSD
jgi:hypothetical protein